MFDQGNAHVGVYQVLDEVLSSTTGVPPGVKGALFSIIDHLRASPCLVDSVHRAEQISLEIHKLESALRAADVPAAKCARDELKSLAVVWLKTSVSTTRRPLIDPPPPAEIALVSRGAPALSFY